MGMILRIASSRIVGQGDIVGRSGYFSLNLSANSVMRGRLDARRTLKSLVADLRMTVYVTENPNNRTMAKYDKVYDGDFEKWVKFANSLKLRMAIRIRFADREYARQMAEEAINHSIGVITSNEDNATSLGTKNQLYTVLVQWPDQCVSADITSYMKGYNDPRMSKYFKRKRAIKEMMIMWGCVQACLMVMILPDRLSLE
ncbi:SusD/RagB family nutrient-binding outer membrane lipoprotein [Bacteroides ovatus]|nr:SusD/RagB family nutrient-binding outer membrane lipoprotein [Bacteroides ovatus]